MPFAVSNFKFMMSSPAFLAGASSRCLAWSFYAWAAGVCDECGVAHNACLCC
jgi:hypothetical protein